MILLTTRSYCASGKEKKEGKDAWRVTLEDPHTGEQKGFSELEELFNFLHQMTSPANPTDPKKAS
ncbi:MAG: hypothetical protein M1570_04505 [Chloroflexi bacterium]|nr:hypothetical protein [Chloroflexota bacterium]